MMLCRMRGRAYMNRRTQRSSIALIMLITLGLIMGGCSGKSEQWTDTTACGSGAGEQSAQAALTLFINAAGARNTHDLCRITNGITYGDLKTQIYRLHRFLDTHSDGIWRYTFTTRQDISDMYVGLVSYQDKPVWLVSLIDKAVEEHLDDPDFDAHRFYVNWPQDGLYACPRMSGRFEDSSSGTKTSGADLESQCSKATETESPENIRYITG